MFKNEKKIIFSVEVDRKISGLALVLAFLSIGIFLWIFPNYFGNKFAVNVIRWIFILVGAIGLTVEFSRTKSRNIKGFDNLIIGGFLFASWIVSFIYINKLWVNIICFFIFPIGLYGMYLGLIQIIYSTIQTIRKGKEAKKSVTTDIGVLLTKILGLILVIIQIIKALGTK